MTQAEILSGEGSPFTETSGFLVVDLDRFQGPLDLLLHLIRTQDIDVFDIPISKITLQFLEAIKKIRAVDLDNAGEFLEMAASLVRIKAQMLLPRHGDDEDLDPRAELVRRLLEYEQIREISDRLQRAETERSRRFPRGYVPPRPRPKLHDTPLETGWDEVFEAALGVELPERIDHRHRVTVRPVAMEDKVVLILDRLTSLARVEFSKLLTGIEGLQAKMHGVMTLLASLELTRRRQIYLRQVGPFSELWVYRRDEDEDELPIVPDEPEDEGQGDFDLSEPPRNDSESAPGAAPDREAALEAGPETAPASATEGGPERAPEVGSEAAPEDATETAHPAERQEQS